MSGEQVTLAVDLGTSALKVALVDDAGRVHGWEAVALPLLITPDGGAEQAPGAWWSAFLEAARRLLDRGLVPREAVTAVCCSTQGEGTVPVDRDGLPLMNCLLWMDMRGAPALRRQFRGLVNAGGMSLRRVLDWIRITGGMPSPTGKDPAAHMLLVRDAFPEVYARTHKFLNVLDFMNLRLTGRFVATHDSILTSWVTDNRDPARVRYHPRLVRGCGIDPAKLPEVVPCTTVLGPLLRGVAGALGLEKGVQVVAGAIDNTAAAIGSGGIEDHDVHLYLGTSTWMAAHVDEKRTSFASALASVPGALPNRWLLTALQATGGGNLTFLRDRVLFPGEEPRGGGPVDFAALDRLAAASPPGARGLLYTPWIWGERAPVEDHHLRAGLLNLSLENGRADVVRAVLEGVALNSRWLLRPVERFLGQRVDRIRMAGGGAGSDAWCQVYADVLDREVLQLADPVQANARGAAFIAAVGLRRLGFADVPARVPVRRAWSPRAAHRALYDDRFAAFTEAWRRLAPLYRRLNRVPRPPVPAAGAAPAASPGAP